MATKKGRESRDNTDRDLERTQDPYVERVRPDPAKPPEPILTMAGLLGDSDRPGFRRLYFTRALDYYAEISIDDIVTTEAIPPERPPFIGLESTRLTIKREAPVMYTHKHPSGPFHPWDLDVKIAGISRFVPGKYVVSAYVGCLERLSVAEDCPTQKDTTCLTCHGPACTQITAGFSCDYYLCPRGGDQGTAYCSITCGGGECPESFVSCKPC